MVTPQETESMLGNYRVLDLTDEKGFICGNTLGDLGADVIKIEKPGGDPARKIGPFYHDEPDPEKSLFWFAYNASKRGITLDIETAEGKEIFKKLVEHADLVIESFPPGYMDKLGLGYSDLEKVNPGVSLVSISPFGQTGPYKDYQGPDIVAWAMGGRMYPFGDPDRPPVRISHYSQAYLHAGMEAAVGSMLALHHRRMTGEGQHVDVSIQASVAQLFQQMANWDMIKINPQRGSPRGANPNLRVTRYWPCKDGHVIWFYWGGPQGKRWNPAFIDWLDSEGFANDFLKTFDWETHNYETATQEVVDRMEQPAREFFMARTKAELYEGASKHRVMLYPVATASDILAHGQLAARQYWVDVQHPELDTTITYPGSFAHSSVASSRMSRRAPLIGEHNQEIYQKEMGLSEDDLLRLKQASVI